MADLNICRKCGSIFFYDDRPGFKHECPKRRPTTTKLAKSYGVK